MTGHGHVHNHGRGASDDLDRRYSNRVSSRLSSPPDEDSDDEFALQAMGISDGFRPTHLTQDHISNAPPNSSSLNPPNANFMAPPRPSSITKPQRPRESLSLRHDGDVPVPVLSSTTVPHRDQAAPSTSSVRSLTSPFSSPDDAYQGPSAPSHPYQMYPQNVRLARTASLATTSTASVSDRSYVGPRNPTHPYRMYPQNTASEADSMGSTAVQNSIPVGFPGTVDNYQRRIGPEGEEAADLIGPDGHTEELPPYTRYPEDAYHRKALGLDATSRSTPAHNTQPISGAGGIGLATRNPEFASSEDLRVLDSPNSRQSVRSFATEVSNHEINTAAMNVVSDEKHGSGGWRVTARRKVWGVVPCWAIVLAVIVLVLMGVILGAVLGALIGKKLGKPHPDRSSDFELVDSLPADLLPLHEGEYALPLRLTRSPTTCLADPSDSGTWSCNMEDPRLVMAIKPVSDANETTRYSLSVSHNNSYALDNNMLSYGMQPLRLVDEQLTLVRDTLELDRGLAWAFEIPYDKRVIVPEEMIAVEGASSPGKRRRGEFTSYGDFLRKGVAQVGERPWICYWDRTLLETFVYVAQNNQFDRGNSGSLSATATSSSASSLSSTATSTSSTETTTLPEGTSATPTSIPSGTDIVNHAVVPALDWASHLSRRGEDKDHHSSPSSTSIYSTSSSSTTSSSTTTSSTTVSTSMTYASAVYPIPTDIGRVYPHVVKIMERRLPELIEEGSGPWCRQYEIHDDGREPSPVLVDGAPVDVQIRETDSSSDREAYSKRGEGSSNTGEHMSECGCLWWLT